MSPQLVSNRKIRPERERLACSEHQPFQKKKGEGARSGNLLFMFFIFEINARDGARLLNELSQDGLKPD